jgi:hypothetical protein
MTPKQQKRRAVRTGERPILIQTTVPVELQRWVEERARREGISVSAWVRRLIMHERERKERGAK